MESSTPLRQSASVASRLSALSQLDKINAIPNKTTNNVLMDGLCEEDKLYLDALMDEDSLNSDDETPNLTDHGGSTWSPPMASRPTMNSKRIKRMKRLKPAYTITMSLEDISYIRPSWGISKGIKRIELMKDKKIVKVEKVTAGHTRTKNSGAKEKATGGHQAESEKEGTILSTYNLLLAILVLIVIALMVLSHFVEIRRHHEKMYRSRLELVPGERLLRIMKVEDGKLIRSNAFQVHYGRGLPKNLRHAECTCEMYEAETRRHHRQTAGTGEALDSDEPSRVTKSRDGDCFFCLDWSHRANVRVFVNSSRPLTGLRQIDSANAQRPTPRSVALDEDQSITCYEVKWQSYDTLRTPLVDCFRINDNDQWLGLGDIQQPTGILNKINQLEPVAIMSNLSGEFFEGPSPQAAAVDNEAPLESPPDRPSSMTESRPSRELTFGSFVEFQLLTQSGFYVGNVRTDFRPAVSILAERREICLSVSCTEHCTKTWSRLDDVKRLKHRNNLLEYSVCSASNHKVLVAQLVSERSKHYSTHTQPVVATNSTGDGGGHAKTRTSLTNEPIVSGEHQSSLLERLETVDVNLQEQKLLQSGSSALVETAVPAQSPQSPKRQLDGLGLIEGTLFVTSPEYIELLDGKTLRQYADQIVKLNLKTKPILILDSRWQLYSGSFKVNSAHFPKAKLLSEILHNKGFKLVLTVKPYIDATIGVANLNQLLETGRIVGAKYEQQSEGFGDPNLPPVPLIDGGIGQQASYKIFRRQSFFLFKNETIYLADQDNARAPYLFKCKESHDGHCALIDLANPKNRLWLIDLIKRSNFLVQEADGILLGGAHPIPTKWNDYFRTATSELIDQLTYKEGLFVIPQWTGNFNYIQLAPRARDWLGLRSTLSSVLTLSALGFSLVHPGSVWGDLRCSKRDCGHESPKVPNSVEDDERHRNEEELAIRWLQLAIFMPILQFNDLEPVDRFHLHDQLQNLIKLRKLNVVPELKRNLPFSPMLAPGWPATGDFNESAPRQPYTTITPQLPALRRTWSNIMVPIGSGSMIGLGMGASNVPPPTPSSTSNLNNGLQPQQQVTQAAEAVGQQFMIGPDMLVAPVLSAGQRQKDIYLPPGQWHDELRQINVRGGKWLRNYPIELNEVAWFTRAKR